MAASSQAQLYCFVQWDDDKNDFAVVHAKRAKTSCMLKVGLTTTFEGNNRDRRRGKILYIGTKSDCIVYSFDFEESNTHINTYTWSLAPGLAETIEETARAIKSVGHSNGYLSRTASSSSVSSLSTATTNKRKVHKENACKRNSTAVNADIAITPSSTTQPHTQGPVVSTITVIDRNQPSNTVLQHSLDDTNRSKSSIPIDITVASCDHDGLVQENKLLRQRIIELEEEVIFLRETSPSMPDDQSYQYMKSLAKKLPCTDVEIKLAKKPNPAATINNLIKCCFKNVDLADMSYEKLKMMNSTLLVDIYQYVRYIHAPRIITQTMFSGAISLKCRHERDKRKNKDSTPTPKPKRSKPPVVEPERRMQQEIQTIELADIESFDVN